MLTPFDIIKVNVVQKLSNTSFHINGSRMVAKWTKNNAHISRRNHLIVFYIYKWISTEYSLKSQKPSATVFNSSIAHNKNGYIVKDTDWSIIIKWMAMVPLFRSLLWLRRSQNHLRRVLYCFSYLPKML